MDRWVEIDIDWFGDPPWEGRASEFVGRIGPLMAGADGLKGVCLNIGFLADLVTEWTGRPEQHLPLRSRRFARWAALTYDDLRRFLGVLRTCGTDAGMDLRLGLLIAGLGEVVAPPVTGSMYDLFTNWYDRHPELYPLDISPLPGPDLDPRVPMHADEYPYATRPGGISEGEPFPEFFGDQWGSLSGYLGLDLIHLRDGFLGPLLYTRVGPYGVVAADDPEENRTWTDAVRRLFRACKDARPEGLVMAYSSGISGTAEWQVGCVDLETIVADGALDIFIDQTWGGAWQDWWDDTWKGWTFQLAYLLGHAVQVRAGDRRRETPCRHYHLIETWDGWEPWDTLNDTPGKLRWATWAFAHAAVIATDGVPIVSDGTYISWMNDWNGRLIGEADVRMLAHSLDVAAASAGAIEEVFGPVMVLDRAGLEHKASADPASNASEWVEDEAGMMLKWGAPIAAAAQPDAVRGPCTEGLLWQLPRDRSPRVDGPVLMTGRADLIDPAYLAKAGVELTGEELAAGYRLGRPSSPDLPREERLHLPQRAAVRAAADDTWLGYDSDGTPLLLGRQGWYYWQPPDLADPGNPLVPHSQIGTVSPYVEAVRLLAREADAAGGLSVRPVNAHEPVTISCWRSAGLVHVLLGNLESGWMGDSRFPRTVHLRMPGARFGWQPGAVLHVVVIDGSEPPWAVKVDPATGVLDLALTVAPSECLVARLEPTP